MAPTWDGDMRRKLFEIDLKRMMIPVRYWNARYGLVNKGYKRHIESYLKGLEQYMEQGTGLLLFGPNGVGKTAAATVILKEARRRGYTGLFIEAFELHDVFLGDIPFEDRRVIDRATEVDLLVIDDLGKGIVDKTGFLLRKLEGLLRDRYDNRKVTIITTNLNPGELSTWLSQSAMSILRACVIPVFCKGEDLRVKFESSRLNIGNGNED